MHKIIFFLFFIFTSLYAQIERVEMLANRVEKQDSLIKAYGSVLVYSQNYLITANKAIYNQNNDDLELFGDINFIKGANDAIKSNYVKLNLNHQTGEFNPFFTFTKDSEMWLECQNANSDKGYYITQNAIVSSCDIQNPDWSFVFTKGKLDKKNQFLHLRNVTFYIRNTPIFYLPYFGISTNKKRKTGLLIPTIGYSKSQGLTYLQPFYIAQHNWWDLEIVPQIISKIGIGTYNTFRFTHSKTSKGSLLLGGFKHKKKYAKKHNLKNSSHKGIEFKYENTNLLENYLSKKVDDALLIDATWLNDVDYLNYKDQTKSNYSSLSTSKINYYINTDKHYAGLYAKYHIDTSKISNENTIQELPTIQYHYYLNNLFLPNLLYSFDARYHNFTRQKGLSAKQFDANLPLTFYTSFFNDYLNFSISENIYATKIYYNTLASETYAKNFHKISLSSDLSKSYTNFYHNMQLKIDYIIPSFRHGKISQDFLKVNQNKKRIDTKFTQYFYNTNGKKKLKHAIQQSFNLETDEYRYGDLNHEFAYFLNENYQIKNNLSYSFLKQRFSKFQTSISAKNDMINFDTIHTYSYDNDKEKQNFIKANIDLKYDKYLYFGSLNYDLKSKHESAWKIGYKYKKKCWEYQISYKVKTSPKLTSSGSNFIKERGFYIAFELYPIGGGKYDFSKKTKIIK